MIERILFAAAFLALVSMVDCARAHPPTSLRSDEDSRAPTIAEQRLIACGTHAVRAAWGAMARRAGAPPEPRYVPMWSIKRIFDGELPMPASLLIAEELDAVERAQYLADAMDGYTHADQLPQDFDAAVAALYFQCTREAQR